MRAVSTGERSTTVLAKKPTARSSSVRPRPEVTVPMAMSSCPDQRANSAWQAATSAVNSVVRSCAASRRSRSAVARSTVNSCTAPAAVRSGGRGRSVGSSRGTTPSSRCFQ
ncbi:hypothetical protein Shyhy02_08970 [Streptomyces hygroscopicus subsp. hygroscopicus]|nr:hypothetical protein Shyhy02_08970 [Streptomyces hygroscopicus subsp. hygroscopicus]